MFMFTNYTRVSLTPFRNMKRAMWFIYSLDCGTNSRDEPILPANFWNSRKQISSSKMLA